MKPKDITTHPLLDDDQRKLARTFKRIAATKGDEFSMLDFASLVLRACARDYGNTDIDQDIAGAVNADAALRHAAVLYVYEALKACDMDIITEWPEFNEMLRSLETLNGNLP